MAMPSREIDPEAPWDDELPIPRELMLSHAPCGRCGEQDVLIRPDWTLVGGGDLVGQWMVRNRPLVDQIAVQGNTCSNCIKWIYEENRVAAVGGSDTDGNTLLHYAARSDNLQMLYHLICLVREKHERSEAEKVIRKLNRRRETALHEAIRLKNKCMVGLLMRADRQLAKYPRPDLDHPNDTSPLYLAVSLSGKHIAGVLHDESRGSLSYCGPNGQNALHAAALHFLDYAAALHAHGMVEMLLRWKKDLRKQTDKQGRTPLHYVAMAGFWPKQGWMNLHYLQMLRRATCHLLGDAKQPTAFQQDNEGFSPLHIAALMDSRVTFRILVSERRGCIGLRDNRGRTFLHIAVQNKMLYLVNYACQDPIFAPIWNARDNDGNTALHLAVKVGQLSIFCALLQNPKVELNLRNYEDETPLDLASSEGRPVFAYNLNSENVIYWTLVRTGGSRGSIPLGMSKPTAEKKHPKTDERNHNEKEDEENSKYKLDETEKKEKEEKEKKEKEEKEKKDSDQMNDSTRTLGVAVVLIASVTFATTFSVPAAIKASDHSNRDTPTLFGTWYFKAFMMANTLAFLCALTATVGLMFSGMSMVELPMRRFYFRISTYFTRSAFISWTVAFATGVYMVLGQADSTISNVIFLISEVLLFSFANAQFQAQMVLTFKALYVRRGLKFVCLFFMWRVFWMALFQYWPILLTIIVAALR